MLSLRFHPGIAGRSFPERAIRWHGNFALWRVVCLAFALLAPWHAVQAQAVQRQVYLVGQDGERLAIGVVRFDSTLPDAPATFTLSTERFENRFLAMRPFQCLDGATWSYCHFPFATQAPGQDRALMRLEYQLMFLRKPRASVSLDPTQGIYYRLTPQGAHRYEGALMEVDMTPIIDPAAARDPHWPIRHQDLFDLANDSTWMPRLLIE